MNKAASQPKTVLKRKSIPELHCSLDESTLNDAASKVDSSRDDYVNNNMFDQDEAIAAAVDKRKFLLKRLLEDQGRFPDE